MNPGTETSSLINRPSFIARTCGNDYVDGVDVVHLECVGRSFFLLIFRRVLNDHFLPIDSVSVELMGENTCGDEDEAEAIGG